MQKDPEGGYHSGLPYEGTVVPRNGRKIDNTFFEGEPDYELFRRDVTMAGYDFSRLGLRGVSGRLNVNNLLDKEYVASCYNSLELCYYGAERNVTASVSVTF